MSPSHRRLSAGSATGPDVGRPPASPGRFERLLVVANRLPGACDADADGIEACADALAPHRAADVMLSTPVREASGRPGLAAVAARSDGDGVLIVSDLSPAVDRLAPDPGRGALAVSPYDVEALTATILRSLALPESDRRRRMRYLRTVAASPDLDGWVESVCRAAGLLPRRGAVAAIARRPPHRSPRRTSAGQAARPA